MRVVTIIVALLFAQCAYAADRCRPIAYDDYEFFSDHIADADLQQFLLAHPERKRPFGVASARNILSCDGEEVAHVGDLRTMVFRSPHGGQLLIEWRDDILVGVTQSGLAP